MTPKQKAIDIVESMSYSCRECDYEAKAKQCALIAVDEILRIINLEMPDCCETIDKFIYYNKVRRQIEAL